MGISLLDACMFDVRDTLIYESQLEKFKNGEFIGGTGKSEFRVRKVKKYGLLKKDFAVSATVSSKTNYTVTVCANPSCTCQDNRKYGESVFCKHIMFVLLKILVVTDESILTYTCIEKVGLVSMFNNAPITIPENLYVRFETPKRNLATILREHRAFKKPQKVILGKKLGRSAKCRACRKEFNVGEFNVASWYRMVATRRS